MHCSLLFPFCFKFFYLISLLGFGIHALCNEVIHHSAAIDIGIFSAIRSIYSWCFHSPDVVSFEQMFSRRKTHTQKAQMFTVTFFPCLQVLPSWSDCQPRQQKDTATAELVLRPDPISEPWFSSVHARMRLNQQQHLGLAICLSLLSLSCATAQEGNQILGKVLDSSSLIICSFW